MDFFFETVEVAMWIYILAFSCILFLLGALLWVVYLLEQERSKVAVKPNASDSPSDDENDNDVIKNGPRDERA